MLKTNFLWKACSFTGLSVAGSSLLGYEETKQLFGFSQKKKVQPKGPSKTYIWGNGIYQAKPGDYIQFKNFAPKIIKNFNGTDQPYLE